ncbi:MAG: alpha/beta fold hydrolase [Alphaproteobacteria bacterium]|nr:alpha/beta fold hydrolase [Alphaproteobacteria bacterium]
MSDRILRHFVDIGDGEVHYRSCGDPNLPGLVMFHGSPGSSYSLVPLMRCMAKRRHVIAPDTPGNGDSSPLAKEVPAIDDLAAAHFRALQAIGLDRFDIYGYHTGAAICTELSGRHGDRIGRVVLDGVSVFAPDARAQLLGNNHAPDIPVDLNGTQLMAAWSMVRDAHIFWPWWDRGAKNVRGLGLPSAEQLHGEVLEVLKASRTYFKSYRAALNYPKRERLPRMANPVMVTAAPKDQLRDHMDDAVKLIPDARKIATPSREDETGIAETARIMLDFLDSK